MKVIVCGGRNYLKRDYLFQCLDSLVTITEVIEGGANGADTLARLWAMERKKKVITVHADWENMGKAAGYHRDIFMISMKPDAVVAFPGGMGTKMMSQLAILRNVMLIEFP